MPTYNNTRNSIPAEADFELAEYGIVRTVAKKGLAKHGKKDDFFTVEYEGPGEGATIHYGTVDEISDYGSVMYKMAPDNNDSMNMLGRQEIDKPFVNMSKSELRKAIGKILDSV